MKKTIDKIEYTIKDVLHYFPRLTKWIYRKYENKFRCPICNKRMMIRGDDEGREYEECICGERLYYDEIEERPKENKWIMILLIIFIIIIMIISINLLKKL